MNTNFEDSDDPSLHIKEGNIENVTYSFLKTGKIVIELEFN